MLVIMQGPSGSGKSTFANNLKLAFPINQVVICCTDTYFNVSGKGYIFDPKKLGEYHALNQQKACSAMDNGLHVIVDNTNIHAYEAKPYVLHAVKLNIPIVFVRMGTQFKSVHDVSQPVIDKMWKEMEELSVEKCCNSVAPWETVKVNAYCLWKDGHWDIVPAEIPSNVLHKGHNAIETAVQNYFSKRYQNLNDGPDFVGFWGFIEQQ